MQHPIPHVVRGRWYQFTVRGGLLLMVLAACGFMWAANKIREAEQQREAVQSLDRVMDATYEYQSVGRSRIFTAKPGEDLGPIEPYGPQWLRSWLGDDISNDVVAVTRIRLCYKDEPFDRLEDRHMAFLGSLRQLRSVNIDPAPITDNGLRHLSRLHELEA